MFNNNYAELHIGLYIGFISREKDINYCVYIYNLLFVLQVHENSLLPPTKQNNVN